MSRARWIYADVLRIVAIIGVVLIHLTASVIDIRSEVGDIGFWWTAHFIDAAFRWSVPVFIMISGMLMLAPGRSESILAFYIKRFKSIVPLFFLWSLIYYLWNLRKEPHAFNLEQFFEGFIKGSIHYHLWFVYMIVILYSITPLLRMLVRRASLSTVFGIGAGGVICSNILSLENWSWGGWGLVIHISSLPGYVGYFLIGYVLSMATLKKGISWLLYAAGILSYIVIVAGTNWLLTANPAAKIYFYEYTSIPVFFTALAAFVVARQTTYEKMRSSQFITVICSAVLHIYLSHVLIMEWLYELRPWDIIHSSPLEYVPIVAVLIILASLLIDRVWRGGLFAFKACFTLAVRFRKERDLIHPLKEIYQYREMLRNMVLKDLRMRYKGSALGFLWTFMNPLLMLGIYTAVFSFILKTDIPHFPLFILVALLPWNYFSQSITGGARSMINHAELMKKVYFPREVIPLSVVGSNLINFLLTLVILIPALWFSGIPLTVALSSFPIVLITQTLLILPIVMLAALATVYLRDLEHILNVLMVVGFYLTPILFPVSLIPNSFKWLFEYNPMTTIVNAYREIILYGQWPDLSVILPMLLVLLVVNVVAFALFALLQKNVVEEV